MAAGEGFEPSQTESESVVLPLHNPAILHMPFHKREIYYTKQNRFVNRLLKKISGNVFWQKHINLRYCAPFPAGSGSAESENERG